MRSNILKTETSVCQLCSFAGARPSVRPRSLRIASAAKSLRQFSVTQSAFSSKHVKHAAQSASASTTIPPKSATATRYDGAKLSGAATDAQIEQELGRAAWMKSELVTKDTPPTPIEVMKLFTTYEEIANKLRTPAAPQAARKEGSATSALLSISKAPKTGAQPQKLSPKAELAAKKLSDMALGVLELDSVFITPEMLAHFVDLHTILGRPEALPTAFNLYANKQVPIEGSKPLKFKEQNPKKSANAVQKEVADKALQVAIDAKQLVVAMDIVDTTYNTTAYRRAKFIRKALFPTVGLSLAPVAAYVIAGQLAQYQTTMDPAVATNIAFVGLSAYITLTTVVGVVAVTTSNDQMERITWAQGLPLRERWLREDERAAIDKMAMSWGFKELWKRGEEEGDEWEHLKEWVAMRGMILDKTELMEGME